MSSVIGHISAGVAVYLSRSPLKTQQTLIALPLLILLAIAPDFDYLPAWIFGASTHIRATHSLFFCLCLSTAAWLGSTRIRSRDPAFPGWIALSVAACSHLVLDLLVGVHSLPLFWPFAAFEASSPLALLPSAGQIRLSNYYLWRNLLIESGILIPLFWLLVVLCRGRSARDILRRARLIAPIWLGFLVWSIAIHT